MAVKKANPIRAAIEKAVKNYANASANLVRTYETVIDRYWNEDSRSTDNLVYFVNLLSDHPRVQQALVRILSKHGKFTIKSEGKPQDKTYKIVELKNVKIKDTERDDYLAAIRVFKAAELSSFLNEEGEMNRDFNADKAKEGFKRKALSFVAELMIKHDAEQNAAAAALEAGETFERVPFDMQAAFEMLQTIVNDAKEDPAALDAAVTAAKEGKEAVAVAKAEKEAKLRAARLEILAESTPDENAA